jgi:F-type H+-transporting ATPase subunit b
MRAERQLLSIGEHLVSRACRRLPEDAREERYREWVAELPAILHDPQIRFAPRRAVRMLAYAADTARGAALTPARARRRTPRMVVAPAPEDGRPRRARRMMPGPQWIVAIGGAVLFVAAYPFIPAVHQLTLGPSLAEMILSLALFLSVFTVLGKVVSRARNVIATRSSEVGGNLANARNTRSEAGRLREEYRTTISGAQREAAHIRQEARERGARIASQAREQALMHARQVAEDAADEIRDSRASAVAELQPQVAEIAMVLSERILGEPPSERSSLEPHL